MWSFSRHKRPALLTLGVIFLVIEGTGIYLYQRFYSPLAIEGLHHIGTWREKVHPLHMMIRQYLYIEKINKHLVQDNISLRHQVRELSRSPDFFYDTLTHKDIYAEVLNHTFSRPRNYLTLNKGSREGLKKGMGLFVEDGIVGQIAHVSLRYATAYSVLHRNWLISASLGRKGPLCSVRWDGREVESAEVLYLVRNQSVQQGDTLFTSGYDNIFLSGMPIGTISEVVLENHAAFYSVRMRWSANVRNLHYVYALQLAHGEERDSIERAIREEY